MTLAGLQPWLRPYGEYLLSLAPGIVVTSVYRSPTRQAELYNAWVMYRNKGYSNQEIGEKFGIWTPAKPGTSYHNFGRAFDIQADPAILRALGAVWKSWGGKWWESDPIHFQA